MLRQFSQSGKPAKVLKIALVLVPLIAISLCQPPCRSMAAGRGLAPVLTSSGYIIDQAGRRIRAGQLKRRIISLYSAHTENLLALGLEQSLVGVTAQDSFPPAARRKPVFSAHDDPERLLAAKPDLVLIRPMIDRGHPDFVRRLEDSGVTVVSLQPRNIDEVMTYWEILGALTGRQQRARRLVKAFGQAVADFRRLTNGLDNKPLVYFEAIHSKMKTFAPSAVAIFVLEAAGGINVAGDAPVRPNNNIAIYGKERILSHARQIEYYLAQQGAMNPVQVNDIVREPGFEIIKAVNEGKIYLVSEKIVSRPTCRLLVGIQRIGTILHPKIFLRRGPAILERFQDRADLDPVWIEY